MRTFLQRRSMLALAIGVCLVLAGLLFLRGIATRPAQPVARGGTDADRICGGYGSYALTQARHRDTGYTMTSLRERSRHDAKRSSVDAHTQAVQDVILRTIYDWPGVTPLEMRDFIQRACLEDPDFDHILLQLKGPTTRPAP